MTAKQPPRIRPGKKQVVMWLDTDLVEAWKKAAADRKRTLTADIIEAMARHHAFPPDPAPLPNGKKKIKKSSKLV